MMSNSSQPRDDDDNNNGRSGNNNDASLVTDTFSESNAVRETSHQSLDQEIVAKQVATKKSATKKTRPKKSSAKKSVSKKSAAKKSAAKKSAPKSSASLAKRLTLASIRRQLEAIAEERAQYTRKVDANVARLTSQVAADGTPLTPAQITTTENILNAQRQKLDELDAHEEQLAALNTEPDPRS